MRKTIGALALSLILLAPAQLVLSQEYKPSEAAFKKAQQRLAVIEKKNKRIGKFFQENPPAREAFLLIGELIFERDEARLRQQKKFAELIQKQDEWKIAREAE